MMDLLQEAPQPEQIELSLFGNGCGECVVCHLGRGNWMIVDSTRWNGSPPVALEYLRTLGVKPEHAVRLVVASHYHDDHVRGLAEVVESCKGAKFCTSAAFADERFHEIMEFGGSPSSRRSQSSGLAEFAGVNEALQRRKLERRAPALAVSDREILGVGENPRVAVWSLSPSDATVRKTVGYLHRQSRPDTTLPSLDQNPLSVVLWLELGDQRVLLGGDMPTGGRRVTGWSAIVHRGRRGVRRAAVYKVAHHGSPKSDLSTIWTTFLRPEACAVVTPFGSSHLPGPDDRARIKRRSGSAFIAGGEPSSPRRDADIEWLERHNTVWKEPRIGPMGQVRLRAPLTGPGGWTVETSAHAGPV